MWRWWSWVLTLGCLMTASLASPAAAAPGDEPAAPVPGPVVVVGVPDLRWQDLDPAVSPTLWGLVSRSSVGAMTDRSGQPVARRATGWLTLNTGTRARADVEPGTVPDPTAPSQLQALRATNRTARYDAQVGALGDALRQAGHSAAAVGGPGADLGAMAGDGVVDRSASSVADALGHADVVVVELPQLYEAGRRDAYAVRDAVGAIDTGVAGILQVLPAQASLLVAGVSEAAVGSGHLHLAMASGPTFRPGWLTSASTGRAAVVQLIDVAPTVLWLLGAPAPPGMLGAPWRAVPDSGTSTAQQVSSLVELDRRSRTELAAELSYWPTVIGTAFLFIAATVTAWTRRRACLLRPLGAVVATVPAASWLVQLVPWWRAGTWLLAPLTFGVAAVIGLTAALSPWTRLAPWRTVGFVGAVTAAVIVADASTGSPLSLDAPFGDNPIVAGRFHGIGNVAFALLGSGTLLVSAAVATGLRRRAATAAVFGLGAVAVAVDGHPGLGDDFGGVLALLPAVAVLGLVVSGVRVSTRHAAAVLAATVTTAAAMALYDYSGPPSQRTHVGRFIGQVADGSAGTLVHRKLDNSLATFTSGWPRWIVAGWIVLALAAYVGHRLGRLRVPGTDRRTTGGLLAALVVLAVVGAAANDSGLAVAAFTFYVAAPMLVLLVEPVPGATPSLSPPDRQAVPRGSRQS
jgi:hypothetical protein